MSHVPVMSTETLEYLLHPGSRIILDRTVGGGGHAEAVLAANDELRLIGVDRDPTALKLAARRLRRFGTRVQLVQCVFADLEHALAGVDMVDGVLLDLGVSSMQLDTASRGFSHSANGPLDMRMGADGETVAEYIARVSDDELAETIRKFGEVRRSRRIAQYIKRASDDGRLTDTLALRGAVVGAIGPGAAPSVMSQVFQSLRIAINDELAHLDSFLARITKYVSTGGRIVIISYHSLEDRTVKQSFRDLSANCVCPPAVPVCVCGRKPAIKLLTRRAVKASSDEIAINPRSRSARLRAAVVVDKEAVN